MCQFSTLALFVEKTTSTAFFYFPLKTFSLLLVNADKFPFPFAGAPFSILSIQTSNNEKKKTKHTSFLEGRLLTKRAQGISRNASPRRDSSVVRPCNLVDEPLRRKEEKIELQQPRTSFLVLECTRSRHATVGLLALHICLKCNRFIWCNWTANTFPGVLHKFRMSSYGLESRQSFAKELGSMKR